MGASSLHVSQHIDRSAAAVYQVASDPARLPDWAAGLGESIENVDGQWVIDSPDGRMTIEFVPANEHGVLDHTVTLPSGESVYNLMRVIADGDGCEVVFTLRRQPSMSDEDFDRDAQAVAADLASLKRLIEAEDAPSAQDGPEGLLPLHRRERHAALADESDTFYGADVEAPVSDITAAGDEIAAMTIADQENRDGVS